MRHAKGVWCVGGRGPDRPEVVITWKGPQLVPTHCNAYSWCAEVVGGALHVCMGRVFPTYPTVMHRWWAEVVCGMQKVRSVGG